jgi:hypothetical protein
MYRQFADLGAYEHHVIDSSALDTTANAQRIQEAVATGRFIVRTNTK